MTATKEDLTKLFETFTNMDNAWEEQKKATDAAYAKRSDAVKAIALAISPSKKVRFKGTELTIVVRSTKDGDSWFFRGMSKKSDDVPEIG